MSLHTHVARHRVQTRAATAGTFARLLFVNPFRFALGRQFVLENRIAISVCAGLQIAVPNFTKPAAFLARAMRRIEREQARVELFERAAASWTAHLRAHNRESFSGIEQTRGAATDLQRALNNVAQASGLRIC